MRKSLFILFILFVHSSFAQSVQWASTVLGVSSQVSLKKNGAVQLLGKPTALPQGGMNLGAWKPTNRTANEYVKVGFANPKPIQQVLIAENYRSGGVLKVFLYDTKGKEHEIPRPDYVKQTQYPGIKSVVLDKITDFPVAAVKLVVENDKNYGMEIDAIGISESIYAEQVAINILPYNATYVEPENLGPTINTKYSELLPVISPDGKSLFFSRRDDPANLNKSPADDVYYSILQPDNKWSPAKNIGAPINNSSYNSPLSISPDGNSLLLMNVYFKDGHMEPGLSMSKKIKTGWTFPSALLIDNYYNNNDYNEFCISHSGKVLIMTLERKDSKGSKDLYVGFRKPDGNWSEPKWLGPLVNSGDSESSPFLAADEKTLFYSTRGLSGYGSNDIFMTKRLDDTWLNWSEPQNLGPAVNTNGWDAYFTIPASGEYAYLVSRQNTLGAEDIFRVKLPKEIRPEPVVLVQGTVYNAKTKLPIPANIFYEKLPSGENAGLASTDPSSNKFIITLPSGYKYGFLAESPGFVGVNEFLDLTAVKDYKEFKKDLYLVPIEDNQVVRMNNVFFETKKYELRTESFPELNRFVNFLNSNPKVTIEIAGHTDNVGTDADNQLLSEQRAKAVYSYFQKKNINLNRISAKGYGKTKPLTTNDTEEGRQTNRRVEFTILRSK